MASISIVSLETVEEEVKYLFRVRQGVPIPKGHSRRFVSTATRALEKRKFELVLGGQTEEVVQGLDQTLLLRQGHAVALDLKETILLARLTDLCDYGLLVLG